MDFWELTNQQLVETLHRLDLKKGGNVPKKGRNVLQTFCRKVLWLPCQSTRRLSGGTGILEEHLTRRREHDKVSPY